MNTSPEESIRIKEILQRLEETYPSAHIALHYHTSWELLVATILSAQCTDVMVNKVTERLFVKYRNIRDYAQAALPEFEQDIKSTGFYHVKAKNIRASAEIILKKFDGLIPKTMEELIILPGVARKTANIVLGNAYGVVVGIPVDTHVSRISQRLRLVTLKKIGGKNKYTFEKNGTTIVDFKKDADTQKIERELMAVVPKNLWFSFSYEVIDHGRTMCKAQNPRCSVCPVSSLCPASRA